MVSSLPKTRISYADYGWSVVTGCPPDQFNAKCSANCWASELATRFPATHDIGCNGGGHCPEPIDGCDGCELRPKPFSELILHPDRLEQPLHTRKPGVVFVAAMGDLFHEQVPDEFIDRVLFRVIDSPRFTFLFLTKRTTRMRDYFLPIFNEGRGAHWERIMRGPDHYQSRHGSFLAMRQGNPLPNVWLFASITDQEDADARIPELLATPAAHRGVSYEPALAPVAFRPEWLGPGKVEQVICGGESPRPRIIPTDEGQWLHDVMAQCKRAKIPCYRKQASITILQTLRLKLVKFAPEPGDLAWNVRPKRKEQKDG